MTQNNRNIQHLVQFSSVHLLSRVRLLVTPWTAARQPGLPVHRQLLEFTQTHLYWVGDAIQSSHPLLSPSPPAFSRSQVFSSESALHIRWPKYWSFSFSIVLPMNIQDWFTLEWSDWISLQSKGLSRGFSNTTVLKHQFFSAQLLYSPTLTSIHDYWKNHSLDSTDFCWQSTVSAFQYAV